MAVFNEENMQEKHANKTVLAVSPCIVNQVTAEKLAREQFFGHPPLMFVIKLSGLIRRYNVIQSGLLSYMNTPHL